MSGLPPQIPYLSMRSAAIQHRPRAQRAYRGTAAALGPRRMSAQHKFELESVGLVLAAYWPARGLVPLHPLHPMCSARRQRR